MKDLKHHLPHLDPQHLMSAIDIYNRGGSQAEREYAFLDALGIAALEKPGKNEVGIAPSQLPDQPQKETQSSNQKESGAVEKTSDTSSGQSAGAKDGVEIARLEAGDPTLAKQILTSKGLIPPESENSLTSEMQFVEQLNEVPAMMAQNQQDILAQQALIQRRNTV